MLQNLRKKSSGYPTWVQSEADKEKYIGKHRRGERIALDKSSNSNNAWQRYLAKLKLNSMWGKWAQNQNKTHTTVVKSLSFTSFWQDRLLRSQTSYSRMMTWYGYPGNIRRITAAGKNVNVAFAAYETTLA